LKKKHQSETPVIENRKARFDYTILETVECGIMLYGPEVKSVREGKVSLNEGYVSAEVDGPRGAAMWLHNVNIGTYNPAGANAPPELRMRKLLAKKTEIARLARATAVKGVTMVPLKVYFNSHGFAKVLVGVGEGKKSHDKRDTIKKREMQRDMDRAMGQRDR
jgi:SsrA-binding protein